MPKSAKKPAKKSTSGRATKRASRSTTAATKSGENTTAASSKQSRVLAMLRSPAGATIDAIMTETGWRQHSVRGFLAAVVRKRLGLQLQSSKADDVRIYRIDGDGSDETGRQQSKRRAA